MHSADGQHAYAWRACHSLCTVRVQDFFFTGPTLPLASQWNSEALTLQGVPANACYRKSNYKRFALLTPATQASQPRDCKGILLCCS